jgi:tetratricopeptide (TPR) repeat protein/GGDEF domain-containing protein
MVNNQKLFEKAEKLLQKQKFDSARDIFLKLFEIQPHNETVLLNLADLSLRVDQQDDSLRYNRLLADLYIKRQDTPKAVVACRKILKAAPQDVSTLEKLASLLKNSRKTAEAADAFREAIKVHRRNGETAEAVECLQQVVDLEPVNIDAHLELARLAGDSGNKALAAETMLKAAAIARQNKMEDRWAELAERAHQLDPANEASRVATAEVWLTKGRAGEAISLLEPISLSKSDDATALNLLCRAYLSAAEYGKAEPVCLKLYRAHPETIGLIDQLIQGLLSTGETARALAFVEEIKGHMFRGQNNKTEFLELVEQIHHADENNLQVLELLPPLYNELNRERDLRRSLPRLFNLYLAGEQYDKAAETLERILDVDPYGASHSDRLLNLEGHIDAIWYSNIAGRISLPGAGQGLAPDSSTGTGDEPATGAHVTLEDLIVEGEMYHRYHLAERLEETLRKIDRLYPGAHEVNQPLSDLYDLAHFQPTPVERPPARDPGGPPGGTYAPADPAQLSAEKLGTISAITASIHRQGTPERVLSAAAEQLGRLVNASRCWLALGDPEAASPLTAEYVSPGVPPSDPVAALKLWSFLLHHTAADSEGWSLDDVSVERTLAPIAPELHLLGIHSLLGMPLVDKEELAGLLIVEQCQETRRWTASENMLLRTIASQVVIAINNTKLRRLVRSLAGPDSATGLLPRSAYLDCLLAEAKRAEEQSSPLSACLMEPADAASLSRKLGESEMLSYFHKVGRAVSSHVRQNDIAIRYGPCTIALYLPDTPLAHSLAVIEKLREYLRQASLNAHVPPDFCAAVGDLFLGRGFGAVDAVTEIINRLEASMETLRKQPEAGIIVSRFEG